MYNVGFQPSWNSIALELKALGAIVVVSAAAAAVAADEPAVEGDFDVIDDGWPDTKPAACSWLESAWSMPAEQL